MMCLPVDQLHSRAKSLVAKFKQGGGNSCIDKAIVLDREALELCPSGHHKRYVSLELLCTHLGDRYEQLGVMTDLEEAILLSRDTLVLCNAGHPNRRMALNNLAVRLSTRFKQLGAREDLNEAIVLDRGALELCQPGHPDRSTSLNNPGSHLSTRYKQLGVMEDLNEAIILTRDALTLLQPGNPLRSSSLNNLGNCLFTRYNQLRATEDLDEAIALGREALALHPPSRPDRPALLNNLEIRLSTRYKQLGAMEDLDEAIELGRDALALRPLGHPDRSTSLHNLAAALSIRYHKLEAIEDLDETISLARDVLALLPAGHPLRSVSLVNLAVYLSSRYKKLGREDDLNETIDLGRDALALRPPGHPDRSRSLDDLARHLLTRFTQSSQLKDKKELFSLYAQLAHPLSTVSSTDLFAARSWIRVAEDFHHPTTLLAYQTCLRLLTHHIATLPPLPQHRTILKGLTSSLAVDAFSACLRNGSPKDAVQLLEQGRGVFWSQLTRLRSPLDDVIASGSRGKMLANKFTQQTLLIRTALDSPGADQHDRVCRLNIELHGIISRIRELPGLSHFLLPPPFSSLQQAARGGPVIIVNASEYGCDALVVLVDRNPVHIPLSITKEGVRGLSSKLSTLTEDATWKDVTEDLTIILRELWDKVVSPIVDFLQTVHPIRSRIWWCPTAEFSLLPIHAAGPHTKGQQNLANLYISSYTTTLTALIHARRHDPQQSPSRGKHFVGIGQANAEGENEIVSVSAELANIEQRVGGLATFKRIEGEESCIPQVSDALGKNEWVHFACHGIPDQEEPFESAFALGDGHFTIERIVQCQLQNAEFAFLSACQTTVGDEESTDEVMHLASAMQFAGFRSVIGTMWAVMDVVALMITSAFYDNMIKECGCLDYTHAALALNRAIEESTDIPLDLRVLYIHIGA